jgi:nitrite reductase/ring-hydroxylating ferredoxin subunit
MSGTRAEAFVTVARVGEIPPGGVKVVRIGDQEIALFHLLGGYHAMDDVCTHDGGPLAEGSSRTTSSSALATARASISAPARC